MRLDRYDQGGYAGGGITENGGNISGPLVLAGNPSQTLEAVPKQYVDAYFNSLNASNLTAGTLAAARLPNFTGDLQSVAGTSQLTLANSGVIAGEHGKVTVNAKGIVTSGSDISDTDIPFGLGWDKINPATLPSTLAGYGITNAVSVSGGTLTGFLSVTNQPTLGTHVATKQYVDALVSSGGIAVGDILRKPYSNTPVGFLKCNGAEVDKTTFADLYSVIGDQYRQNTVPGNGRPWEQQYQINTTQTTDITGWTAGPSLPNSIFSTPIIVTKNRVYIIGSWNGSSYFGTVYSAAVNTDGSLGAWVTETSTPIVQLTVPIIIKNRVYLIGGYTTSVVTSAIYYAPINADGTLGTWVSAGSLPLAIAGSVIVTGNRVYMLGCSNNSVLANTYSAPINSDGSLGAWVAGNNLPVAMNCVPFVTKNRVYLVGCDTTGSISTNLVYTASINSDGYIGPWASYANLPSVISRNGIFVTKNRVYLLGGRDGTGYASTVYTAPINSDGTLGTWSTGTALPQTYCYGRVFAVKNKIYLVSGATGSGYTTSTYMASISSDIQDYSPYYDGTIIPIEPVNSSTKFTLPDLTTDEPFGSYSYIKY